MATILPILGVVLLGLVLLMLEFFFIPGFTVAGVLGILIVTYGIWQAYGVSPIMGHAMLFLSLLGTIGSFIGSYKTAEYMALDATIDGKMNEQDDGFKVGDIGIAFGDIKPTGKAIINDQVCNVTSMGDFISDDMPIVVIQVTSNTIYIRRQSNNTEKKEGFSDNELNQLKMG